MKYFFSVVQTLETSMTYLKLEAQLRFPRENFCPFEKGNKIVFANELNFRNLCEIISSCLSGKKRAALSVGEKNY